MARRSSRNRSGQRDAFDIANDVVDPLNIPLPPRLPRVPAFTLDDLAHLDEVQDYRRYDPTGRDALTFGGSPAPSRRVAPGRHFSPFIAFDQPSTAIVCHRRKTRREVLFAKRKRRGRGRRKRSLWSNIRC